MSNSLPTVTRLYQNHHLDSTRWQAFHPRPDDIILSTSYKSGTTWMQGILRQLVFLNQPMPPLDNLSPWLDRRARPLEEILAKLDPQTNRRFIKSHLPLDGLPFYPHLKYIIVGRDARDVLMSLWNHYSHYTDAQYANLNETEGRVGPPMPPCPADIHEFARNWLTRGWFAWESEGYPFWATSATSHPGGNIVISKISCSSTLVIYSPIFPPKFTASPTFSISLSRITCSTK